jgi:hypothetical protein
MSMMKRPLYQDHGVRTSGDAGDVLPRQGGLVPLAFGAILLLAAALSNFVLALAFSPGFTYVAVLLGLWGLGTLLAGGLKA